VLRTRSATGTLVEVAGRRQRIAGKAAKGQHRIAVGVDGSSHGFSGLRWALRQTALTGATIEAVACWQRPAPYGHSAALVLLDTELAGPVGEAARAAGADSMAATTAGDRVRVQTWVVEGNASRVLVNLAAGADLLVVGSRGHGELPRHAGRCGRAALRQPRNLSGADRA